MGVQIPFQVSVFISFGYIPRGGTAGSYNSSIFNFLRILHAVSTVAAPIYNPTMPWYYNLVHPVPFNLFLKADQQPLSLSRSIQPVS